MVKQCLQIPVCHLIFFKFLFKCFNYYNNNNKPSSVKQSQCRCRCTLKTRYLLWTSQPNTRW